VFLAGIVSCTLYLTVIPLRQVYWRVVADLKDSSKPSSEPADDVSAAVVPETVLPDVVDEQQQQSSGGEQQQSRGGEQQQSSGDEQQKGSSDVVANATHELTR
jgi:hypothetical protein